MKTEDSRGGRRRVEKPGERRKKPEDSEEGCRDGRGRKRTKESGKIRKRLENYGGCWRKREKAGRVWMTLEEAVDRGTRLKKDGRGRRKG